MSEEVLSGANAEGKVPVSGGPNLYLYDGSKTGPDSYRFVGTLAPADAQRNTVALFTPINERPFLKTSRVSPDGESFTFMSLAPLTDYDNTDGSTGEPVAEVYLYNNAADAGSGGLSCVSCNPSGARPHGEIARAEAAGFGVLSAGVLPPYETELYGARLITDDGDRVFFESFESLVPADTNGKNDSTNGRASGLVRAPHSQLHTVR